MLGSPEPSDKDEQSRIIIMMKTDKTELLISLNGTFEAITEMLLDQANSAAQQNHYQLKGRDDDGGAEQVPIVAVDEEDVEYIFDRLDVRVIFITLYSVVFACCFFGK